MEAISHKIDFIFDFTFVWIGFVLNLVALIILFVRSRQAKSAIAGTNFVYLLWWQYSIGLIYSLQFVFKIIISLKSDSTAACMLGNFFSKLIYCLPAWMQLVIFTKKSKYQEIEIYNVFFHIKIYTMERFLSIVKVERFNLGRGKRNLNLLIALVFAVLVLLNLVHLAVKSVTIRSFGPLSSDDIKNSNTNNSTSNDNEDTILRRVCEPISSEMRVAQTVVEGFAQVIFPVLVVAVLTLVLSLNSELLEYAFPEDESSDDSGRLKSREYNYKFFQAVRANNVCLFFFNFLLILYYVFRYYVVFKKVRGVTKTIGVSHMRDQFYLFHVIASNISFLFGLLAFVRDITLNELFRRHVTNSWHDLEVE